SNDTLPSHSLARQLEGLNIYGQREREEEDWKYYLVNKFVDRDMLMRFRGGAVGHIQFRRFLGLFERDAGLGQQSLPVYDSDGEEIPSVLDPNDEDRVGSPPPSDGSDSDGESWVLSDREVERDADDDYGAEDDDYEHAGV
ncbi:hypothetical protein V5O48_019557, partial [Marasmius crinis-equi]